MLTDAKTRNFDAAAVANLNQSFDNGVRGPNKIMISYGGKEASGLCLFHKLHGVQRVGGSNPLTPTLNWK